MNKSRASKIILSTVLLGDSAMSFALDWSQNHLLNPQWHPHAKYHSAILLFLFAGVAGTGSWLLWRRSLEPKMAITAAALLSASYWTPFFFVPFLLSGSSWWAGIPGHEPRVGGVIIYPNLVIVGIFLIITVFAWCLGVSAQDSEG